MEIAAGNRRILVRKDDRVVGNRSRLDGQRAGRGVEQVERSAHHLRLTAEAVWVLHLPATRVAGDDLASVEEVAKRGGDADLPRLAAKLRDADVERFYRTLQ